ncbi:carbon-nitrogen hydrolase family protein [Pseudomonas sp. SBB6]|uniref:carbon-nitrogen hydrolase family protein n=1 Tax=Pseudomonas sp. SBB6 TaxID=2962032 RepID=UPI0020B68004|nr:carbon-nitrogen hydrolase family protein [Pseudomonas sp. SBB6]MCP3752635.1 carbon-nitrogen hydrolase family protein [Pseudomonas sp. SBB6]
MTMTVACAQTVAIARDITGNVQRHLQMMQLAAEQGVQFLLFPELSLTGYELDAAPDLALGSDDPRLDPLRELARKQAMYSVVGAPVRVPGSGQVLLAALIFRPDGSVGLYSKQHLHPGEDLVFSPGSGGDLLPLGGQRLALAICADAMQPGHPAHAARLGADVYAAGMLISHRGIVAESQQMAGYAVEHQMMVMLANHGGETGGWQAAGQSAIWARDGALICKADGAGECLVVARQDGAGAWEGTVIGQ